MISQQNAQTVQMLQPKTEDYQATLTGYGNAKKLLNYIKTWEGFKTRSHWTGLQQEKIGPLQQALILECLYQVLEFYIEDDTQTISKGQVYRWVAEALQEDSEQLAAGDQQEWQRWMDRVNTPPQLDQKGCLDAVDDMLLNPNPVVWLELQQEGRKKHYTIRTGPHAQRFYEAMVPAVAERQRDRSYKAPVHLPVVRLRSGRLSGMIRYAELKSGPATEAVLQILERRHLWLKPHASALAEQLTAAEGMESLKPFQLAIFYGKAEGYLNSNQRQQQRQSLRRQSLLKKLQDFPPETYSALSDRYYSQSSGRIQSRWLNAGDISVKAGVCAAYPGGVRQAIFAANDQGLPLSTSDCNASAWQLASLLLGDQNTQAKACGPDCDFNTEMTERAINGDYFVAEKLQGENGKSQARQLVKKLLMTVLYGSSANQQYRHAQRMGLGGYWQPPAKGSTGVQRSNGAHRFLKDHETEFPVLKQYVPLMQKVAEIGCRHRGILELPYIFEPDAWLRFDHPQTQNVVLKRHRKLRTGKRKDYSATLCLPISPVQEGRFILADVKEVKHKLPPTVIHSIESAVIKHLILLLDQVIPPGYGFATIHDCVLFPPQVIEPEQIQQLWNQSLQATYLKLGPLLQQIVDILSLDPDAAGKHLPIAQQALSSWHSSASNSAFLNRLWMSTSSDY